LQLNSTNPADLNVAVYPAVASIACNGKELAGKADGIFQSVCPPVQPETQVTADFEKVRLAGPLRNIPIGKIDQPMATAPEDSDFQNAAVWDVKIPPNVDLDDGSLLRIHYIGDVARVTLGNKLITDDFYNGNAFDVGFRPDAPDFKNGNLRIAIIPLQKNGPIYMADKARPTFGNAEALANIQSIEIIPNYRLVLSPKNSPQAVTAR
jgi:hypothetical protein